MSLARRLKVPAPYLLFLAALVVGLLVAPAATTPAVRLMTAFPPAAALYVLLTWGSMARARPEDLARHAAAFEPSRAGRLLLALGILAVVLAAISLELARGAQAERPLALLTLLAAWAFANTAYAVHYAHLYYRPAAPEHPLLFPGGAAPDFADFGYFAFVLGMTFQVSDVAIQDRVLRRQALVHGLLAFLLNLGGLALGVNLLASAA